MNEQTFAQHEVMKPNVTDEMKVWRKMYLSLLSCLNIRLILEINCMIYVWIQPECEIIPRFSIAWGLAPKSAKEKSNLFYLKQEFAFTKTMLTVKDTSCVVFNAFWRLNVTKYILAYKNRGSSSLSVYFLVAISSFEYCTIIRYFGIQSAKQVFRGRTIRETSSWSYKTFFYVPQFLLLS